MANLFSHTDSGGFCYKIYQSFFYFGQIPVGISSGGLLSGLWQKMSFHG